MTLAVLFWIIYRWETKLSSTTCLKASSLVGFRMFLFTPTHMAIPMALQ